MYTVSCETHFDSAHFLLGYKGGCKNIHGHRWVVSASVSSETLIEEGGNRGMVIDFNEVKPVLNELVECFDHRLVVERDTLRSTTMLMLEEEEFEVAEVDFRPTVENFSKYFYDELKKRGAPVSKVRVYETPESYAEYCED